MTESAWAGVRRHVSPALKEEGFKGKKMRAMGRGNRAARGRPGVGDVQLRIPTGVGGDNSCDLFNSRHLLRA